MAAMPRNEMPAEPWRSFLSDLDNLLDQPIDFHCIGGSWSVSITVLRGRLPVWPNLRLWAPEPHDLALTKLERSNERDIRDVIFLAQADLINRDTLLARF